MSSREKLGLLFMIVGAACWFADGINTPWPLALFGVISLSVGMVLFLYPEGAE